MNEKNTTKQGKQKKSRKKGKDGLTDTQRDFRNNLLKGMSKKDAYKLAYDQDNDNIAHVESRKLLKNDNIQQSIINLMDELGITDIKILTRLNKIIDQDTTNKVTASDQIKTAELLFNIKGIKTKQQNQETETTETLELESKSIEELEQIVARLKENNKQLNKQKQSTINKEQETKNNRDDVVDPSISSSTTAKYTLKKTTKNTIIDN